MVILTEVEDEHFQDSQVGPNVDDDDFTDTGMSMSFLETSCSRLFLAHFNASADH